MIAWLLRIALAATLDAVIVALWVTARRIGPR